MPEDLPSFHANGMQHLPHILWGGGIETSAARAVQEIAKGAITFDVGAQNSLFTMARPQNHRPGTITEQDTGIAVLPIV